MTFNVFSRRLKTPWWIKFLLLVLALAIGIPLPALARQKRRLPAVAQKAPPQPPSTPDVLLARSGFADEDVVYLLFDPANGSPLETHRADEPKIPASTNKVITMIAALKILGADYRFETALLATGEVSDHTLHGNLYL